MSIGDKLSSINFESMKRAGSMVKKVFRGIDEFLSVGCVCGLLAFGVVAGCTRGGGSSNDKPPRAAPVPDSRFELRTHCCHRGTPNGFLKVTDSYSATSCGGSPRVRVYNVCKYRRYDTRRRFATMLVCAGQVPNGWELVGRSWSPSSCGHPTGISQNVMTIRKQ